MTILMYLWMVGERDFAHCWDLGYVSNLEQNLLLVTKQLQDGDACIPSLYNRFRQLWQAMGERHL